MPAEEPLELSILMPCLDEAETLAGCIGGAQRFLAEHGIAGEVVVADNGSTDGSPGLAESLGARVVRVQDRGYGSALLSGIRASRGRFVAMGDADGSYDFNELLPFLEKLRHGHHLVLGNRFKGGIRRGAMPALNRYLGNPLLSGLGRLFFGIASRDFHCGLRAFQRQVMAHLDLRTTGMEFASEMVVKASFAGLRICEVPCTLSPDGRSRPPHLRRWRDGWRHLRFMLLYSPKWLFFYPGLAAIAIGLGLGAWLLPGPRHALGVTLDVHTLLYAAVAVFLGFQAVVFAMLSETYGQSAGLLPRRRGSLGDPRVPLEAGLAFGALLVLAGFLASLHAFWSWGRSSFGDLEPSRMLRTVIPAMLALVIGAQSMLGSFFLSMLRLSRRDVRKRQVEPAQGVLTPSCEARPYRAAQQLVADPRMAVQQVDLAVAPPPGPERISAGT